MAWLVSVVSDRSDVFSGVDDDVLMMILPLFWGQGLNCEITTITFAFQMQFDMSVGKFVITILRKARN